MARSVDTRWKGPYGGGIGLSRLVDTYLGRKLAKGGAQTSNWEAKLSLGQQECEELYFLSSEIGLRNDQMRQTIVSRVWPFTKDLDSGRGLWNVCLNQNGIRLMP